MGRLQTLKTRLPTLGGRLQSLNVQAVKPRPAGRAWQATRLRIQVRDLSMCADCGRLWRSEIDHVDHEIPRWQGGSDDDSNLRLRCVTCHEAKTKREAAERATVLK